MPHPLIILFSLVLNFFKKQQMFVPFHTKMPNTTSYLLSERYYSIIAATVSIFQRVACVSVNFCDKILNLMPLVRWFGILGNILICFLEESDTTPMLVVSAHSPP